MGVKQDQFDFPVCNSFRPTVLGSQLCYVVDVKAYYKEPSHLELKTGLILVLDYNEDRQINIVHRTGIEFDQKSFAEKGKYMFS